MKLVGEQIADGRVLELVEKLLTQGILEGMREWTPEQSKKKLRESIKPFTKRANGRSMEELVGRLNPKLRGWFEYFKHSEHHSLSDMDRWVRQRLRAILKKRCKRRGHAKGKDLHRWPIRYFAKLGLFCLKEAQAEELSLRRGATC